MLSVVKLKPKYMHTIQNVVSQHFVIANLRLDSGINGVYSKTISIAISPHLFFFLHGYYRNLLVTFLLLICVIVFVKG